MMNNLPMPIVAKLKDNIDHQGIGGKKIILEKVGSMSYALDHPIETMTIALYNFIIRRIESGNTDDSLKIYYGHVEGLGYFVAEDEFDGPLQEMTWKDALMSVN